MDWKNIPSLSALRAFEATGRLGNQSKAARELNVSHAAIAQHIRTLEAHFDSKLATREGRGIALNPSGAMLFKACNEAFSLIAKTSDELLTMHQKRPITISLTPKFAESWLMPRISDFWEKHPDIEIALRPSEANIDLNDPEFDLAIRCGFGGWPNTISHTYIPMKIVIVATPQYLEKNKGRDLPDLDWLVQESDSLKDRIMEMMNTIVQPTKYRTLPTTGLLHEAISNGLGVGALNSDFVHDEINSGALKIIATTDEHNQYGYHFITKSQHLNPNVTAFLKWFKTTINAPKPAQRLRP